MGLQEKGEGRKGVYLKIRNDVHAICQESSTEVEGWRHITPYNPTTETNVDKWVKEYDSIEGTIKYVRWEESDFGPRVKIGMQDGGEYFQLELPFGTREYDSFSKLCENIDYAKPVTFSAWHDRREDKTAFAVRQDGATVKWKYVKDNMGDCPEPKHNARSGKWNFDDQREWLADRIVNVVIPMVEELNKFDEPQPEYAGMPEEQPVEHAAPKRRGAKAGAKGSAAPEKSVYVDDNRDEHEALW